MSGLRWTEEEWAAYVASKNNPRLSTPNLEPDSKHEPQGKNVGQKIYPRVRIRVHSKRRRLTDPDGVSAKAAIDGLVQGGLLKNDSANEVESVTFSQEKSEIEETVIEIEGIE